MLLLVIAITSGVSSRIFDFPAVDVGGRTELKILDELVVKVAEGIDTIIDVEAVNKGDDGRTILHVAATAGHTKAIEALVHPYQCAMRRGGRLCMRLLVGDTWRRYPPCLLRAHPYQHVTRIGRRRCTRPRLMVTQRRSEYL